MGFSERMHDAALAKDAARTAAWSLGLLVALTVVELLFQGLPWAFASVTLTPPSAAGGLYDVSGPSVAELFAAALGGFVQKIGFSMLPCAIGIFLVLWLLLPVSPGMGLVQIIVRGSAAALAGAALAVVVDLLASGFSYAGWGVLMTLLSFITVGMWRAPVVILVLVARHLVPRRAEV